MSSELLVNVTPQETRVAFIENGMLQEIYLEREATRGILGNIFYFSGFRIIYMASCSKISNFYNLL